MSFYCFQWSILSQKGLAHYPFLLYVGFRESWCSWNQCYKPETSLKDYIQREPKKQKIKQHGTASSYFTPAKNKTITGWYKTCKYTTAYKQMLTYCSSTEATGAQNSAAFFCCFSFLGKSHSKQLNRPLHNDCIMIIKWCSRKRLLFTLIHFILLGQSQL